MNLYLCVTMLCDHHALIPHFLRHYLGLGVEPERFIVTLNVRSRTSDADDRARDTLAKFGIAPAHIYSGPYDIVEDHEQTGRLRNALTKPDDWMICCDLDEFQEYPTPQALPFLCSCAGCGVDFVRGVLVDRTTASGELRAITSTPSLWEQFPLESEISHRLGAAETSKILAHRCSLETVPGHHHIRMDSGQRAQPHPDRLRVHHFKWDATAPDRFEFAVEKQRNPFWAATSRRFLDHIKEWGGINFEAIPPSQPMHPLQIEEDGISFEVHFSQPPPRPWLVRQFWQAQIVILNHTDTPLVSQDPAPFFFSYHWLTPAGAVVCQDGQRSPLFPPLPGGSSQRYSVVIEAPAEAGVFLLQPALVQEQVRWLESVTKAATIRVEIMEAE